MDELKKIRIDSFHYRIRKGRVDVLMQRESDAGGYCIPYHYVGKDERLCKLDVDWYATENGSDLVILDCRLNDGHMHWNNGIVWMPLTEIMNIPLSKEHDTDMHRLCLALFLELCPCGETVLHNRALKMLDDILTNEARNDYRNTLLQVLDGEPIIMLDTNVTPPDPNLLVEEINTLEHFRLYKPEMVGNRYRYLRYSYEPVDWEIFGSKITSLMDFVRV